jgi:hypothetical protein
MIHRDLVIVDSGKEVEFVSTDAGLVISGSVNKQHTEQEVFALAAAEVIPVQTGVEALNGDDRGSRGTASRPVRRMVAQSNS